MEVVRDIKASGDKLVCHFFPIKEFEWMDGDALIGQYHPGMKYNCTAEKRHDTLRGMLPGWEEAGLIEIKRLEDGKKFITVKGGEDGTTD